LEAEDGFAPKEDAIKDGVVVVVVEFAPDELLLLGLGPPAMALWSSSQ
jgi:hypothetical protein